MLDYLTALWALVISGFLLAALVIPHIDSEFTEVDIEFESPWVPWLIAGVGFVLAASSLIVKALA